jgi:citrate/tricarballylate utilization protein
MRSRRSGQVDVLHDAAEILPGGAFGRRGAQPVAGGVIAYPALLATGLLPAVWSVAVILGAAARYWRDVHGPLRDLAAPAALGRALAQAARLNYLHGGGEECYDGGDDPSPARRRLHHAVCYGFTACFASTVSAAVLQDVMGSPPPYPLLSVPVVLGTVGGAGMIAGCTGLAVLKRRGDAASTVGDYSLLIGLGLLATTGMLTLLLRSTPVYGTALVAHLTTIVVCFGVAPYSTFVHGVYRFLALVQDNLERAADSSRY